MFMHRAKTHTWERDTMEKKLISDVKTSLTPQYCSSCTRWCISNLCSRLSKICRQAMLLALKKFSRDDCSLDTIKLQGIEIHRENFHP